MFAGIVRLVGISAMVVTLTLLAVVFVQWVGGQQQFEHPPHIWFEQTQWNFEAPSPDSLCLQPPKAKPGVILMVPIHRSDDGWMVDCAQPLSLTTLLERSAHEDWMLQLEARDTPDLDKLVDSVGKFDGRKRFAVYAPAQKVARDLRKKAPQWLFAADSASLLRFHVFSSMHISPAVEFWPDFVIASSRKDDGSRLSVNEAEELRRRKKRIVWNETQSPGEKPDFPVDGTLTQSH